MSMPPPGTPPSGPDEPNEGLPTPPGYTPSGFPPPPPGADSFPPPPPPSGTDWFPPPPGGGYSPPSGGANAGPGLYPGPLAEWPQRALGALVDWVAPTVVYLFMGRVSLLLGVLFWFGWIAWAVYGGYLNGTTGQSLGKQMAGLKTVGEQTGEVVGAGIGIARAFAHIVDGLICYIGWLFPLWDGKKQTLADKIVKTVVVVVPK